jgi:antitoxin (DNA-binding transcriptional repressor) of toxin-antitoxin stability system
MRLGLREANQQFARVMRAVRAGQEVVLTDRGPTGRYSPVQRDDAEVRLAGLAAGLMWRRQQPAPTGGPNLSPVKRCETVGRDRDGA